MRNVKCRYRRNEMDLECKLAHNGHYLQKQQQQEQEQEEEQQQKKRKNHYCYFTTISKPEIYRNKSRKEYQVLEYVLIFTKSRPKQKQKSTTPKKCFR